MTRENKLALVVGFGLVLIVGILISDHFSDASTRESARLTHAVDPLGGAPSNDPDLIAVRSVRSAVNDPLPIEVPRPRDGALRLEMGAPPEPAEIGLSEADARSLPYRLHNVRDGESLTSICIRYFGDATLVPELARYNDLTDPDALVASQRLRIPDAADLVRQPLAAPAPASTASAASAALAAPKRRAIEYTVQEGDNLSKLAKRFLGTPHAFATIFERNRDVIKRPDLLRAGMVLTIPLPEDVG